MHKAIIVGATSGIGRELAKLLSSKGYELGLTGRRYELLCSLQNEILTKSYISCFDVSDTDLAMREIKELIQRMSGVDLIVISAGCGFLNPELDFDKEKETVYVNVLGFVTVINTAYKHFILQGKGHIVGISSVSGVRGNREAPAYSASKAFVSNYLEGLRVKVQKAGVPIIITDVQPGLVDTDMAKGDGLFWVASPDKAATQIYNAITAKKAHVYVTKRWRIIAWLLRILPSRLYRKL